MKIELHKVACGYGSRRVLENFSTHMNSGEIFCLLGPNGIGKTTLFKTILGFLPLMGGEILLDGRDIRSFSKKEFARMIAYVPQAHTPPFSYRVLDVVVMGRAAHLSSFSTPTPKDYQEAETCMERLGIEHLKARAYTELSGGERQMVLIARALTQKPAFLMMDEPTSNLDFGNQVKVLENVKRLAAEGLGVIMTTHFPDHVFQCDARVALLNRKNGYECGSAYEVLTQEKLHQAYGIDVLIVDTPYKGKNLRFCQPLLSM